MDFSLIAGSLSSLATLIDLGKTAVGVRDSAQVSVIVAQMNDQVLAVQGNLYRHQAELMDLQQKYHDALNELRQVKAREAEHDRYELHEPYRGTFVYRLKAGCADAPMHMLCQVCFDKGTKTVLQGSSGYAHCRPCKASFQLTDNHD